MFRTNKAMFTNIVNDVKMWENKFGARHKPEAPEWWRHLNQTISPEACNPVLAKNNHRTNRSYLVKFTSGMAFSHISLCQKERYQVKIILIVLKKRNQRRKHTGNRETNWCLCEFWFRLLQVRSEHLTFNFPPPFESGTQCSLNGGPLVIWVMSLYQVIITYFYKHYIFK